MGDYIRLIFEGFVRLEPLQQVLAVITILSFPALAGLLGWRSNAHKLSNAEMRVGELQNELTKTKSVHAKTVADLKKRIDQYNPSQWLAQADLEASSDNELKALIILEDGLSSQACDLAEVAFRISQSYTAQAIGLDAKENVQEAERFANLAYLLDPTRSDALLLLKELQGENHRFLAVSKELFAEGPAEPQLRDAMQVNALIKTYHAAEGEGLPLMAAHFLRRADRLVRKGIGRNTPKHFEVLHLLSFAEIAAGDYEASLSTARSAKKVAKEAFGQNSLQENQAGYNEAQALKFLKRPEEALSLCNALIRRAEDIVPPSPDSELTLKFQRASILQDLGQRQEAFDAFAAIAPQQRDFFGSKSENYLTFLSAKAQASAQLGHYRSALTDISEGRSAYAEKGAVDHPGDLNFRYLEAQIRHNMGESDEARSIAKDVHEVRKNVLGPSHPATLLALGLLEQIG